MDRTHSEWGDGELLVSAPTPSQAGPSAVSRECWDAQSSFHIRACKLRSEARTELGFLRIKERAGRTLVWLDPHLTYPAS